MRKMMFLPFMILFIWTFFLFFIQNTESSTKTMDQWESKFARLKGPYLGQEPPGEKARIFAPGLLSNGGAELSISFTPDGKECSYTVITSGSVFHPEPGGRKKWFMMHSGLKKGRWTLPREYSFNPDHAKGYPFYTPDGKKLYFYSHKDKSSPHSRVSTYSWNAERMNGQWINPTQIDFEGDMAFRKGRIYMTSAASGNLYLGMYSGGIGYIYVSKYKEGRYREPQRLSETINNPGGGHPYIAPDESYIIFDDDRSDNNFGHSDLFISFRDKKGDWMAPINMGNRINTEYDERRPFVSFDGKYLFFARDKVNPGNPSQGHWRLYWIDAGIIDELRPNHRDGGRQ